MWRQPFQDDLPVSFPWASVPSSPCVYASQHLEKQREGSVLYSILKQMFYIHLYSILKQVFYIEETLPGYRGLGSSKPRSPPWWWTRECVTDKTQQAATKRPIKQNLIFNLNGSTRPAVNKNIADPRSFHPQHMACYRHHVFVIYLDFNQNSTSGENSSW